MAINRTIHQLWIGETPIPARESAWAQRTKEINPTWQHRLWGNELVTRYQSDPFIRLMVAKGDRIAYLADRLRVLLLRDEGGVYVDADAEPVKPLDSLPVWDWAHVDFVAGLRSPWRKDVALARGIPLVDNTFLASAPHGRMIERLCSIWTPGQVTGENNVINGWRTGIAILEHASYDTVLLNFRYLYCETRYPESLIDHDAQNLASWVEPHLRKPRTCPV